MLAAIRGICLLNDSLRRLGLRKVKDLPKPPANRSLEDIVRLAFTLIDMKDADHARLLADRYRNKVMVYHHVALKLACFHAAGPGQAGQDG